MLSACGGSDSDGDIAPPPPPPPPPVEKTVIAMDFRKSVILPDDIGQSLTFNLSTYVSSKLGKSLILSNIEAIGNIADCRVVEVIETGLDFSVSPKNSVNCDYRYTITDGVEHASGLASVVFISKSAKQMAAEQGLEIPLGNLLPELSKSVAVGNSLVFNIQDELAAEFLPMTNPKFEASTVVMGSGTADITDEGYFSYRAVELGLTRVTYSVIDDNQLIFTGVINIDVSGETNTAPHTLDETYDRLVPVGEFISVDIMNFPRVGPLVTDKEGDQIQLVGVQVYNANVALVNPNDVSNTRFSFKAENPGQFVVNYTVYDHEVDGVSTGTITFNTGESRAGKIEFSYNGFLKLFGDGTLGAGGNDKLMNPFKNELVPYMENNGGYATGIKNIGFGNYQISLNTKETILFGAEGFTDSLVVLPATDRVYYGLTYADRALGYGGIIYVVNEAGESSAINQVSGTFNQCYSAFTDKFNQLHLSDVASVESFGITSAVVHFNDGTATYYGIDCYSATLDEWDFTPYLDTRVQCWNAKSHGSFYCMKASDEPGDAFFYHSAPEDKGKDNFYLDFIQEFNDRNLTPVKTTQVQTGIAALTNKGELYVLFEGKNRDGAKYKFKKVATRVNDYQQSPNFVTYMHQVDDDDRDHDDDDDELEFDGYAQYHREQQPDGKWLDLTLNFHDIHHKDKCEVKFYKNTSNAVLLLMKHKLFSLTKAGFHEEEKEYRSNIIGDSANSYSVRTETSGQGKSTYFSRGYKSENLKHWHLINPLKRVDSIFECHNPDTENITYPYILSGCSYLDFKMNGAVVPAKDTGISVYPEDKFDDRPELHDLVDLDNDGFSTEQELDECSHLPGKYANNKVEYCSQPILSDSDGDNVDDAFEYLYQGAHTGSRYTPYSNIIGEYKHNHRGPIDGNKDIDNNGRIDKYDY
ncbi:hypothetical protein SHVI106290_04450 [Shewanella violacea]